MTKPRTVGTIRVEVVRSEEALDFDAWARAFIAWLADVERDRLAREQAA